MIVGIAGGSRSSKNTSCCKNGRKIADLCSCSSMLNFSSELGSWSKSVLSIKALDVVHIKIFCFKFVIASSANLTTDLQVILQQVERFGRFAIG